MWANISSRTFLSTPCAHGDHQPVVEVAGNHAHDIDADHHAQGPGQAGKDGLSLQKQRGDIVVDQYADKRGN